MLYRRPANHQRITPQPITVNTISPALAVPQIAVASTSPPFFLPSHLSCRLHIQTSYIIIHQRPNIAKDLNSGQTWRAIRGKSQRQTRQRQSLLRRGYGCPSHVTNAANERSNAMRRCQSVAIVKYEAISARLQIRDIPGWSL